MSEQPFFSIIIPVYNSEEYLDSCIESIFSQSFKDFELILIDDQSTDSSPEICEKWHNRYPNIVKVIHQKNVGVYLAKRRGLQEAKGKYFYVIDNDDLIINENALKIIKETIDDNGTDLVIFNAINNLDTCTRVSRLPFSDHQIFENQELALLYDEYLNGKGLHHIWMMVFSRELVDWEFEYHKPFRMLRDGPFLILPILSNAKKAIYLDDNFYYWRIQNAGSASKHYDVCTFYRSVRLLHMRVEQEAKKWQYKTRHTDAYVKKNYMVDVSIAAVKIRSLDEKKYNITKTGFLRMMSDDRYFRSHYTLRNVELFRRPVLFFLYHRQYFAVNMISALVGFYKERLS